MKLEVDLLCFNCAVLCCILPSLVLRLQLPLTRALYWPSQAVAALQQWFYLYIYARFIIISAAYSMSEASQQQFGPGRTARGYNTVLGRVYELFVSWRVRSYWLLPVSYLSWMEIGQRIEWLHTVYYIGFCTLHWAQSSLYAMRLLLHVIMPVYILQLFSARLAWGTCLL